jgi:hypothetical protein
MFMDPDDASASQPPADDLRQIKGIGRGIVQRLQDAGVRSFAELAGHAPADLAAKAGVPTSRVTRERWIAQARALGERSAVADSDDRETADDAERRESFMLRLILDEGGRVRRTSVTRVRGGQEAPPWAGWDSARLLRFLSEYVDLSPEERPRPGPEPQQQPAPQDQGRVVPAIVPPGEIRVRDLEVLPAAGFSQRSLEAGEPFAVRMRLDPAGEGTQLSYAVTVVARTVGEPRRQTRTVGEATGTLAAGGHIELRSTGLPPGIYRLDGAVRVRQPGSDLPHRVVAVQGGLLQVNEREERTGHGSERTAG